MKAVLISIHPAYCELIAVGEKLLEIRKRRPRLQTPFKCYIYQSKHRWVYKLLEKLSSFTWARALIEGQRKVIGEFVCDDIRPFDVPYPAYQNELDKSILKQSCLTYYQLHRYAYHDKLYAWHISNLKIYDKPKALGNFNYACDKDADADCFNCAELGLLKCKPVTRPPQSWCYVEDINYEH